MVDYKDRLLQAMALAGRAGGEPATQIAAMLGITYQAAKKIVDGKSKALNAENHSRAADELEVDHLWLATGEGRPQPEKAWPFELFTRREYMAISKDYRMRIENELAGEVQRQKKPNGTKQSH